MVESSATRLEYVQGCGRLRKYGRRRVDELLKREIRFISNPTFQQSGASKLILDTPIDLNPNPERSRTSSSQLPSHLAQLCEAPLLTGEQELNLFRRMNFLLYQANILRSQLNPNRPSRSKMDRLEAFLAESRSVKHRIAAANVRLVVSLVKQLAGGSSSFEEMLSDGLLAMLRATEKFDYDRGFRFSTYATMVVRRQLYRSMKNSSRDKSRFPLADGGLINEHADQPNNRLGEQGWLQLSKQLDQLMTNLDDRERAIIRARFGFDSDGKKQTLQSLASDYGVCKERVRQLEQRAMKKLRLLADDFGLSGMLDPEFPA